MKKNRKRNYENSKEKADFMSLSFKLKERNLPLKQFEEETNITNT